MPLVDGPARESLFAQPALLHFGHNPLPDLFKKTEGLEDDRLLAIVTALVVEDRLDTLLAAFLPRYNRLTDAEDCTFAVKIALLEATAFIPTKIVGGATVIRRIRNEFAHNLAISRFDDMRDSLRNDLRNRRVTFYIDFGPDEARPKATLREEYSALAFGCIVGLDAYATNLSHLRHRIEDPAFTKALYDAITRENDEAVKLIMSKPPKTVELREGQRIEVYEGGLVHITVGEVAKDKDGATGAGA
jgi:hypothetical protein